MMIKAFTIAALLSTALVAGCVTTATQAVTQQKFNNACSKANAGVAAVQVLYDAGELSAKVGQRFLQAKASIKVICAGPVPANTEDALITAAQLYVVLAGIWRDNK